MRVTPRRTQPEPSQDSPLHPSKAADAFEADWDQRSEAIQSSPITRFLEAHEIAGSPNEMTITGVADVKVTLGDLRAFVRALK